MFGINIKKGGSLNNPMVDKTNNLLRESDAKDRAQQKNINRTFKKLGV